MKRIIQFNCSIFILSIISLTSIAKDQNFDRDKKITKQYTVAVNDRLSLENEYGKVTINTWDKNEVSVEMTIGASAKTDSKAQSMIDDVSLSETKVGGSIYLKTIYRANNMRSGKQSLHVDYQIMMPAWLNINIVNKFGNVFLPSLSGAIQLQVNYGNIKAGKLLGSHDKRIEVSFGSASIDEIDNAFIESKYSKLNIDKIGKAEIQNAFGKTMILEANNLRIAQKYGDLDLRKVNTLIATIEFSNLDLDNIGKSADVTLKYSGNADFGLVSSSIDLLKISASFSTVYMKLDESANQEFSAHLKFGDMKLNNNQYLRDYMKNSNQNTNTADYTGKIGKGGGGNMLINSNYTTIYLQ